MLINNLYSLFSFFLLELVYKNNKFGPIRIILYFDIKTVQYERFQIVLVVCLLPLCMMGLLCSSSVFLCLVFQGYWCVCHYAFLLLICIAVIAHRISVIIISIIMYGSFLRKNRHIISIMVSAIKIALLLSILIPPFTNVDYKGKGKTFIWTTIKRICKNRGYPPYLTLFCTISLFEWLCLFLKWWGIICHLLFYNFHYPLIDNDSNKYF